MQRLTEKSQVVLGHDASFKGLVGREHCQKITRILGQAKIKKMSHRVKKRHFGSFWTLQCKLSRRLFWTGASVSGIQQKIAICGAPHFLEAIRSNDLLTQVFKAWLQWRFLDQCVKVLSSHVPISRLVVFREKSHCLLQKS